MNDDATLLMLPTPIGTIAISVDTVLRARSRAKELLSSPIDTPHIDRDSYALVSAEAIGELFDIDSTWFLSRARENRVPHIRVGKYVRFDPEDVRTFFARKADRHANS